MAMPRPVASVLAQALRDSADDLVRRWLERIKDRVAVEPERVFPPPDLIDHVPLLLHGIADYLEDPMDEITADVPVVAKAMELGALRHAQGFPVRQILWEYEVFGGVVFEFMSSIDFGEAADAPPGEVLKAARRVFRAIAVIERTTTLHYLHMSARVADEREQRLRGFGRALSHELKNALSVVLGASAMLQEDFVITQPDKAHQFSQLIRRNARHMRATMENLVELSRLDGDSRRERNVLLPHVIEEVARQLREFAQGHDVEIRTSDDLPEVHVPASVLELSLSNLVSNAIKYHDPARSDRLVALSAWVETPGEHPEVIVEVRDNGRGIPVPARERLFERFYRVDDRDGVEGTGLGLSLVRDAVRAIGGRVWCEFPDTGETVFRLGLPARREEDGVLEAPRQATGAAVDDPMQAVSPENS
jgi:signal transduction histidine kinase